MLAAISKYLMYPLWDIKDHSVKLREWKELERSQWLPASELRRRQWTRLSTMIAYAWSHSAFYRERFRECGLSPSDIQSFEDFSRIPITTKQDVRSAGARMISDRFAPDGLVRAKTGGSTGVSLELFFDKRCEERRNAAALRSDRWAGWDLGMYRGALWGNPAKERSFKHSVRNRFLDRIFVLDTMEMSPSAMDAFIAEANSHRTVALFGHAHSIFVLARHIRDGAPRMVVPKAIISTSMMLIESERQLIEKVFDCKVSNRYGCEEVGLIASECERHEGLHINVDHLHVEVLRDDGTPVDPGEPGKIVLTDLSNLGMPLLRYRIEDVGVISHRQCSCGRQQPMLERVSGRVADFLKRRDGTLVAGVSLVERTLTAIEGIEQMQLIQNRIDQISINRVKGDGFTQRTDELLIAEFRRVFGGDIEFRIQDVESIPQAANGKYRFSICNL